MVLANNVLPDNEGIELLKEIRKRRGDLPVIIMTDYGEKRMLINALRHRCDGFIEKPFDLNQLINEIERVLDNKPARP